MSSPEQQQPDCPQVVFVPEVARVQVVGTDGTVQQDTSLKNRSSFDHFANALADMYLTVGSDTEVTLEELARRSDSHPRKIANFAIRCAQTLPPELVRLKEDPSLAYNPQSSIYFGRFALMSRRPTPEETAAFREQKRRVRQERFEQRRRETLDAEGGKIDLTEYDHALIRIGDACYSLDLSSADAIVAARTLHCLSKVADDIVTGSDLSDSVWDEMPLSERSLVTEDERELYGYGDPAFEPVRGVLTHLAPQLGVTRRTSHADHFTLRNRDISVIYAAAPMQGEPLFEIKPIYPPGVVVQRTAEGEQIEVSEEDISYASRILLSANSHEILGHAQALQMLDTIMSRQGKVALQAAQRQRGDSRQFEDVVRGVHDMLLRSLGAGYWSAWRHRLIAGNHATGSQHRARQVGGRLPGTTKRWVVG